MGIPQTLTKTSKQAKKQLRQFMEIGRNDVGSYYDKAIGLSNLGMDKAVPEFEQARQDVTGYGNQALGQVDQAIQGLQGYNTTAVQGLDPYLQNRTMAERMYMDSLGLGGDEGRTRALETFQHGPGYQFALDEANRNIMRNQAATGGLNSGETLAALSDRAQGMQNEEWANWQDRLKGLDPTQLALATAQMQYGTGKDTANMYLNKANILQGLGQNLGNISTALGGQYSDLGKFQGGLASNTGGQLANIATGMGSQLAQLTQQQGVNLAQYQAQQAANKAAQTNAWIGAGSGLIGGLLGA